ncbi:7278_t:CDS:2, partial [Gigaspora margarita]
IYDTIEKCKEQLKTKRKIEILSLNDKIVIYTNGCCKDNEKGSLQSNNQAELYATIRAIETCENQDKVIEIKTDRYVVNAYLFEKLDFLITKRNGKIYFTHIFGHDGVIKNEITDKLTKKGAIIN